MAECEPAKRAYLGALNSRKPVAVDCESCGVRFRRLRDGRVIKTGKCAEDQPGVIQQAQEVIEDYQRRTDKYR